MEVGLWTLVVRLAVWAWRKVRSRIPFLSSERKAAWNLADNLKTIDWAIEETNPQHFEQELKALYPKLGKFGVAVPLIEPVCIGDKEYDRTWYEFHLTFMKELRRQIRNERFDFAQWNSDVIRENNKRRFRMNAVKCSQTSDPGH